MIRALGWAALLLLVAAPLLIVLGMGFGTSVPGVPPVRPPIGPQGWQGSLESWALVLSDPYYHAALWRSLLLALATAGLCLVLGFGMALGIAGAAPRARLPLLGLLLLPFWTGFLLRISAWMGLLRDSGWVNTLLLDLGLITAPLRMLDTQGAMILGMVHAYLPLAVLPLYASLVKRDRALEAAAADLGASRARVLADVIIPLAAPALAAAFLLVFIPAAGEVVIPALLGGPTAMPVGRAIWEEFFQTGDWPTAAALATLLLLLLLLPVAAFQRLAAR